MMELNWKYCECGCHGSDAEIGSIHFWRLLRLDNQYNVLQVDLVIDRRQGSYPPDKIFKTVEEANAWCLDYAKQTLRQQIVVAQDALEKLEEK